MKGQGISKVGRVHPLGTINVFTQCNGFLYISCLNISVWTAVVNAPILIDTTRVAKKLHENANVGLELFC